MRSDRIKELRENLKLTQEDIADQIGTSRRTVSAWESGAIPNGDFLAKLARTLNTSSDFLLGLTDDPSPAYIAKDDLSPRDRSVVNSMRRAIRILINHTN